MTELDCPQGSEAWWQARRGRPTGSNFGRIITPKAWKLASGRWTYAAELLAETTQDGWFEERERFAGSPDTNRGNALEAQALRWLQLELGEEVRKCSSFVSDCGRYADSPDGITASGIPAEVKSRCVRKLIAEHISGEVPTENIVQVHAHMLLTGAPECIYLAYCEAPEIDNVLRIVKRSEKTEQLREHVETFCDELEELKAQPWAENL